MQEELEMISQEIIKAEALIDVLEEEQIKVNGSSAHSQKEVRVCFALRDVIRRMESLLNRLDEKG